MDRKLCVLVYSRFSEASKQLLDDIRALPFDLPRVTGMTLISVDNPVVRNKFIVEGVTAVPCLLIQYFDNTKQKLQGEYITMWINTVVTEVTGQGLKEKDPVKKEADHPTTNDDTPTQLPPLGAPPRTVEDDSPKIKTGGGKDLHSIAMAMQKSRDTDDKKMAPPQRP